MHGSALTPSKVPVIDEKLISSESSEESWPVPVHQDIYCGCCQAS